jgi:hypothetical protein
VKRAVLVLVGAYVLVAAGNRVAEHFGAMRCDCAEDCWCRRSGLNLFRWVFPWGHHPSHSADQKAELDPVRT